jgi:hypothetical protein
MVKVNRVSKKNKTSKKHYSRNNKKNYVKKGGGTKTILQSSKNSLQKEKIETLDNLVKYIKKESLFENAQNTEDDLIKKYLSIINNLFLEQKTKTIDIFYKYNSAGTIYEKEGIPIEDVILTDDKIICNANAPAGTGINKTKQNIYTSNSNYKNLNSKKLVLDRINDKGNQERFWGSPRILYSKKQNIILGINGYGNKLIIYDIKKSSLKYIEKIIETETQIRDILLSPDEKHLAVLSKTKVYGSNECKVVIYNIERIINDVNNVNNSSSDLDLTIYIVQTFKEVNIELKPKNSRGYYLTYYKDNTHLILISANKKTLFLFNIVKGTYSSTSNEHEIDCVSPYNKLICSKQNNNKTERVIINYSIKNNEITIDKYKQINLNQHIEEVNDLPSLVYKLSNDGKFLIIETDKKIWILDISNDTLKIHFEYFEDNEEKNTSFLSLDNKVLGIIYEDSNKLKLIDIDKNKNKNNNNIGYEKYLKSIEDLKDKEKNKLFCLIVNLFKNKEMINNLEKRLKYNTLTDYYGRSINKKLNCKIEQIKKGKILLNKNEAESKHTIKIMDRNHNIPKYDYDTVHGAKCDNENINKRIVIDGKKPLICKKSKSLFGRKFRSSLNKKKGTKSLGKFGRKLDKDWCHKGPCWHKISRLNISKKPL